MMEQRAIRPPNKIMSKITPKAFVNVPEDHEPLCYGFDTLDIDTPIQEKVKSFMDRFGAPASALEEYRPVFLVDQQSFSGEQVETVGIFVKDNLLYEVVGVESSIEDFEGQWEPELTSPQALRWRIENGELFEDAYDKYTAPLQIQESLLDCLTQWCPAMAPEPSPRRRSP